MSSVLNWLAVGLYFVCHGGVTQTNSPPSPPGTFTAPFYEKGSSRVLAMLQGVGRFDLKTSRQVLDTVRVDYYDNRGQTNLTVRGTNCVYDFGSKTAFSPQPLRVATGDGRLQLEGMGFTWYQTNNNLIISNDVLTLVRKSEVPNLTNDASGLLELRADRFEFYHESNLFYYSGRVRLTDAQLEMACDSLAIRRSPSNTIEEVLATGSVVLSNKLDRSMATAALASYSLHEQEERLQLVGHPHWTDGTRHGRADQFNLDRRRNILTALGHSQITLPRDRSGGLYLLAPSSQTILVPPINSPDTIEISAGSVRLDSPSRGTPMRRLYAETNVVILDSASDSRATADRAVFGEDLVLELTGRPEWVSGERMLSAGRLTYDTKTGAFAAHTNVFVRFPVAAFGASLASRASVLGRDVGSMRTNEFIEILSDAIEYQNERIVFEPEVKAVYRADQTVLGSLACAKLAVQYSTRFEGLEASGGFELTQEPSLRRNGTVTSKHAKGRTLQMDFDTNGALHSIKVEGDVHALFAERHPNAAGVVERQLACESISATFGQGSNFVDKAVARGSVVLRQGDRVAQANMAQYSDSDGLLRLTGQPIIMLPEGRITDAAEVSWERARGMYRVSGKFFSRWKRVSGSTNLTTLLPKLR